MVPTQELKKEHEAIKVALGILEKMCQQLELGEEVNPEDLENMAEFMKTFADNCHHGKEEKYFYPAMEEAGVVREGGPIDVMLTEHDLGRDHVKKMRQAIHDYKDGVDDASVRIMQSARDYIALLSEHIEKEDTILFPMADSVISPAAQNQLAKSFELMERDVVGEGKHEEFHRLLDQMRGIYLK